MNIKNVLVGFITLSFLLMLPSCSAEESINQSQEPGARKEGAIIPSPFESPEERKITSEVLLAGNFQNQITHFYSHYGRVPSSYEEWRDSGFLIFTPWSGHPTLPAKHAGHTLSVENDEYGTFHYESLDSNAYELEIVFSLRGNVDVLTYERDLSKPMSGPGTGYRYLEAKADAYYSLLDLLRIHTMEFPGNEPASLLDAVDGYVSLVPEGFRMPEGLDTTGAFELGFDFSTGYNYFLSNLAKTRFAAIEPPVVAHGDIDNPPETISDDRLVLFSSELLEAGYPGLFD